LAIRLPRSILGGPLDVIDDEEPGGSLLLFKFEAELVLAVRL
jgi:hypothetical protein